MGINPLVANTLTAITPIMIMLGLILLDSGLILWIIEVLKNKKSKEEKN